MHFEVQSDVLSQDFEVRVRSDPDEKSHKLIEDILKKWRDLESKILNTIELF